MTITRRHEDKKENLHPSKEDLTRQVLNEMFERYEGRANGYEEMISNGVEDKKDSDKLHKDVAEIYVKMYIIDKFLRKVPDAEAKLNKAINHLKKTGIENPKMDGLISHNKVRLNGIIADKVRIKENNLIRRK
ncbi:MAG: hypothetical protein ABR981_06020 [Candidatus Micrarchaeaceae archaeon]|jgi:hypothetical protein